MGHPENSLQVFVPTAHFEEMAGHRTGKSMLVHSANRFGWQPRYTVLYPSAVSTCLMRDNIPTHGLRELSSLRIQNGEPGAHFSNILLFRSPRDSRYAIKSRTSSVGNVSINPSGIIDTLEVSIVSIRLRFTLTSLFGSSMSVLTMIESPARLTMRPVTVWPSLVPMMTAAYWSLMTLLGSTMDSSRSRTLKRPAAPVRSGPDEPPSLS